MKRINSKTTRIVAFVGALGASAALVGTAATATGAYFTDSKSGSLSGSAGHIKVDVSGQNLNFTGLMPGEYQSKTIAYSTNSTGNSDVWMVFNPNDPAYQKLTGAKTSSNPDGGLGGYGHFAVYDGSGAKLFSSWNLQNQTDGKSGCADDQGHGGNNEISPSYDYSNDTLCGIPQAILIKSGIPTGDYNYKVTFGITPKAKSNQDGPWTGTVPFKVVATQPGVNPLGANINNADKF